MRSTGWGVVVQRGDYLGAGAGVLALGFGYVRGQTTDVASAVGAGWSLVHRGTLAVPAAWAVPGETVTTHAGLVSDRPVGMVLVSAVSQVFAFRGPSPWGVLVVTAALVAATVAGFLRVWPRLGWVAFAASPFLAVAGRTLWPETVICAAYVAGLHVFRRPWLWPLCVPLVAFVTVCRLPAGVLAAALLAAGLRGRYRAAPLVGLATGVLALIAYGSAVFGTASPAGAYPVSHHLAWAAVATGLVSPARGLLVWSPWLLAVRLPRCWRVPAALVAAYVLGTWLLYDAWSGAGWAGYRYALPLVLVAAPHLRLTTWSRPLVGWSVGLAAGTLLIASSPDTRHWWQTGVPWPVLALAASAAALSILRRRRAALPAIYSTAADDSKALGVAA